MSVKARTLSLKSTSLSAVPRAVTSTQQSFKFTCQMDNYVGVELEKNAVTTVLAMIVDV